MAKASRAKSAKPKAQGDVEALIRALAGNDPKAQQAAADALGELGDTRAVDPLIERVDRDSDKFVRSSAIHALGMIRDPRAAAPIALRLWGGYNSSFITNAAEEALVSIGPDAVEGIERTIRENLPNSLRLPAVGVLGRIGGSRAVAFLCEILADKPSLDYLQFEKSILRAEVVKALGKIGDPAATETLISVLLHKSPDDTWNAMWAAAAALDKMGWRPGADRAGAYYWAVKCEWDECLKLGGLALEPLLLLLEVGSHDLSIDAATCLGNLGDARAIKPLVKLRKTAGRFGGGEQIDEALAKLGWKK